MLARKKEIKLISILVVFSIMLILKACATPIRSTIDSIILSNTSFSTGFSLNSQIYYINGLATRYIDAIDNVNRIREAVTGNEENILSRLIENIGFRNEYSSYYLAYNMALGGLTFETGAGTISGGDRDPSFQVVASIALKIREVDHRVNNDLAWQLAHNL